MEGEGNPCMSPYNTVMNTELKISLRENIALPLSNEDNETTSIKCNSIRTDVQRMNPYSDIQVLTSPPDQQPVHLPVPPLPITAPPIPSRNMSTDQFLSLLNQLITTQEPALASNPSYLPAPQDLSDNAISTQKQTVFTLNRDYSFEPSSQQWSGTMDDMHTIPYRRDSEEKRASLAKSFSVPSLLNISSHIPQNPEALPRYDVAKFDVTSEKNIQHSQTTLHTAVQSVETTFPSSLSQFSAFSATGDPPKLVSGPQSADELPPGVLAPLPHHLSAPTSHLMSRHSEMQPNDQVREASATPHYTPTDPPSLSLYPLPHTAQNSMTASSSAPSHFRTHSSAIQQPETDLASRDLIGQMDLLRKREQMLQTAKIQLEDKCATLLDRVETFEAREHMLESELESMRRIRSEHTQKLGQLEQHNQLLQKQVESSRQQVSHLERRVEALSQQCRLKDEANSHNTELYQKLEAADKMIKVFQERLDSSRLQLSQQEALIGSLDARARAAESALAQSQQEAAVLGKERVREKERYNQDLQRVQGELQADRQRREQEVVRARNQLIQENEKFQEEYHRLREEYENQKVKFDRLLEEFRLTQSELERKQKFVSQLEQELREKQSDLGNLKATVSKYESMEDNYKRTVMRQEEDIRHLQHTNNRLHNLGSMQTSFQSQSDVSKYQYSSTSSQIDSPSSYPRTSGTGYSRHWADPSPDTQREIRSSSALADHIPPSSTRATASCHVWPSDSESEFPEPVVRGHADSAHYRGSFDDVRRPHPSSYNQKLNCSFDVAYPKDSVPSPAQHDRVRSATPHSEPRKKMAWISEVPEEDTGNGISDEEKYKLLLSLDQNAYHKSQSYKSSRSSSLSKPEKPYSACLGKISEVEEMYDQLQSERQLLESALNRGSGRASRQSRQKREDIECRLDEVMKDLGSIRMKLRTLGILKT